MLKRLYKEFLEFLDWNHRQHSSVRLALGPGGEEGDEAAGQADAENVVYVGGGATQDVEGGDDHQSQEQSVVVEDGEGGGLILSNLILLPQDPLVLLLLADLLVIRQLLVHLLGDGGPDEGVPVEEGAGLGRVVLAH